MNDWEIDSTRDISTYISEGGKIMQEAYWVESGIFCVVIPILELVETTKPPRGRAMRVLESLRRI
jgi:hypothetical protein